MIYYIVILVLLKDVLWNAIVRDFSSCILCAELEIRNWQVKCIFLNLKQGSYVFMDVDYGKNLDEKEQFVSEFQQSLYVLSTVQSVAVSCL